MEKCQKKLNPIRSHEGLKGAGHERSIVRSMFVRFPIKFRTNGQTNERTVQIHIPKLFSTPVNKFAIQMSKNQDQFKWN